MPRSAGAQPYSYLHPVLGGPSEVTSTDSTPLLPFGHGLTYTTFARAALTVDAEVLAGDAFTATVEVTNTGERAGTDVVQLYARDLVGSVTRPVAQLLGYARVDLDPGESVVVRLDVPTARLAFSDRSMVRVVEPGEVELWVGPSCAEKETTASLTVTGPVHEVTLDEGRTVRTEVLRTAGAGRGR
jgi:beta-glucosidase